MIACLTWRWEAITRRPVLRLIPGPIELLGCAPELHNEVAGEVLRLRLAALLPPELDQGCLIAAHDDPGI
jgi:hypothetical protein